MNETWGGDNWFANWVLPDPKANWGQVQAGMADLVHGQGAIDKTIGGLTVLSASIFLVTDFIPGENLGKNALKKGAEEVGRRVAVLLGRKGEKTASHLAEKTAKQTAEQAPEQAAKATRATPANGSSKPDFVVTEGGTAIPVSQSQMREGFDKAGFPSRSPTKTSEAGQIHTVPGKDGPIDVRTMEGSAHHPKRAVFTEPNSNNPVKPDGSKFRNNETRQERRAEGHIEQKD